MNLQFWTDFEGKISVRTQRTKNILVHNVQSHVVDHRDMIDR